MNGGCSQKLVHWCLCKLGAHSLETNNTDCVYRISVMGTLHIEIFLVGNAMDIGEFYLNSSLQFSPPN